MLRRSPGSLGRSTISADPLPGAGWYGTLLNIGSLPGPWYCIDPNAGKLNTPAVPGAPSVMTTCQPWGNPGTAYRKMIPNGLSALAFGISELNAAIASGSSTELVTRTTLTNSM